MSSEALPSAARVVVGGGGVVGCSVAYHLAKLGERDVVLLEQGQLSCGTTWHAAGLVGQLRSQSSLTALVRYSTELYAALEAETGLSTGWRNCGSVSVARTPERMVQLRRTAASARAQGVDVELITPAEAGVLWPLMETDDLQGGLWLPGDGKASPTDLTQALARGAREAGVRLFERMRVEDVLTADGRISGVRTAEGVIAAEIVVHCAGQWARGLGALCGVSVPLHSAEHMYIVTGRIDGVRAELPVLRDPDGYVYFKEEVGGLAMGGFEPDAKPWGMDGIPEGFEFSLLPDDWDHFEILMEKALERVPQFAEAEIRKFYNGPESFTPDNAFLLGEAPELANFFVGAGFNSMGIASAGGAGRALAEWIVAGEPTSDLWAVDIRRFSGFNANPAWLRDRVVETLGLHYAMPWPDRELRSARPLRCSPLHDRLAARGAVFGSKMGWERVNWFAAPGPASALDQDQGQDHGRGHVPGAAASRSFGRPHWHERVAREHRAARTAVALFDQSSFGKLTVEGRDALAVLQRLCAANVDRPVGSTVYTALLNARGGYESDLTVLRLAERRFLPITGSAQVVRDRHWITRHVPEEAHFHVADATSAWSVLTVAGPQSRALLERVPTSDLSNGASPLRRCREIDVGYATVIANRMSYAGELGWELIVPVELAVGVYELLHERGAELGLVDAGYYALEGLRLEKGYRAWSRELTPDVDPIEAGLTFALDTNKPGGFPGRDALLERRARGAVTRRVVRLSLADAEPQLCGGELVLVDGEARGEVRSAAYGHTLGACVALALIEDGDGVGNERLDAAAFEIDAGGERLAARWHRRPAYDPDGARARA